MTIRTFCDFIGGHLGRSPTELECSGPAQRIPGGEPALRAEAALRLSNYKS
jgi:hypothetical protein